MSEQTKTIQNPRPERAGWERPQVKRLVAGQAEARNAPIADVVYS